MQNNFSIGNLFYPINREGTVHLPIEIPHKIVGISDCIYAVLAEENPASVEQPKVFKFTDICPMPITEQYLLDFGFTKVVSEFDGCDEINYELETKEVFFSYSDDWSLAIADSKKSFKETSNYITPDKEFTNKIHLWQNIFKSLTGKDTYVREEIF